MNSRPEEITQSIPIPEHKMGWIVGKKGSYISQLCKKSGATISISESSSKEYGMVWKYVQITGTGRAVDRAKKLLHIRLDRLEPRPDNIDVDEGNTLEADDGKESPQTENG
jgi:predicted PilT family ATPase